MAIQYYGTRASQTPVATEGSHRADHGSVGKYYGISHFGGTEKGLADVARFPYIQSMFGTDYHKGSVVDAIGNIFSGQAFKGSDNYIPNSEFPDHFKAKGGWYGYSPLGKLMAYEQDRGAKSWGSNKGAFINKFQKLS